MLLLFTLGLVLLFCASFFFLQVFYFRKGFVFCAMFFLERWRCFFFKEVCFVLSTEFNFFKSFFLFL